MSGKKFYYYSCQQVLVGLEKLWKEEGRLKLPVDVLDVLDDLSYLGVKGSSGVYLDSLKRRRRKKHLLTK